MHFATIKNSKKKVTKQYTKTKYRPFRPPVTRLSSERASIFLSSQRYSIYTCSHVHALKNTHTETHQMNHSCSVNFSFNIPQRHFYISSHRAALFLLRAVTNPLYDYTICYLTSSLLMLNQALSKTLLITNTAMNVLILLNLHIYKRVCAYGYKHRGELLKQRVCAFFRTVCIHTIFI